MCSSDLPGLIDSHVHVVLSEVFIRQLENVPLTLMTARAADLTTNDHEARNALRRFFSRKFENERHSAAADLARETFLIPHFHETAGFSDKLRRLAAIGGFEASPTDQVGDFLAAISLAAAGYGIVLGPSSLRSLQVGDIVFRQIEDFDAEIELALAHRSRGMSPCVAQFVEVARELPQTRMVVQP